MYMYTTLYSERMCIYTAYIYTVFPYHLLSPCTYFSHPNDFLCNASQMPNTVLPQMFLLPGCSFS